MEFASKLAPTRASAPTQTLHIQPSMIYPALAKALGVVLDVAQSGVDHGEAFGVMAGGEFIAHAHAAVQLYRLLADDAAGAADLDLGRRHRALALVRILGLHLYRGQIGHGARLLAMDHHVHGTMLQRLEAADRAAELLARLQVVEGGGIQRLHRAHRFGAQRRHGEIGGALEHRQRLVDFAQHAVGADLDVRQFDLGRAHAVDGAIARHLHARAVAIDQEQADALGVARGAGGARRDDQLVGAGPVQHHRLVSIQHVARAVAFGRGLDAVQLVARIRLAQRGGEQQLALRHFGQDGLLLRLAAGEVDQAAAQDHGRKIRLDHDAAAELGHHQHGVDRGAAEAAMRLVEGHAEQAHLGELRPHLVGKSLRRSDDGLARLEAVILADVFLDAVAQQLLFFAENEIHD